MTDPIAALVQLLANNNWPQYDFLLQAILLISATLPTSLQVADDTYREPSIVHLSNSLRPDRYTLTRSITPSNADALMSTTMLLAHHAWSDTSWNPISPKTVLSERIVSPPEVPTLDASQAFSLDPLLALAPGVREVCMAY